MVFFFVDSGCIVGYIVTVMGVLSTELSVCLCAHVYYLFLGKYFFKVSKECAHIKPRNLSVCF